ncbi:MAG: hypothetical protein IEMM0008_0866 [bacterium]|nr:MAG: hypothetical protein IEMM0008_0866 [bacterium]
MTILSPKRWLISLILIMSIAQTGFSFTEQDPSAQLSHDTKLKQYEGFIIRQIEIRGNEKTKSYIVRIILNLKEGDSFVPERFRRSIQRLWNTDSFYSIRYEVIPLDGRDLKIIVTVKDKWSLLPIISFRSGGGVTRFRAGFKESNLFGELKELGAVYENISGEHFVSIWYEDRYFLETHIRFRVNLFSHGFVDTFYNSNRDTLLQLITRADGGSVEFHFPIVEDLLKLSFTYSVFREQIDRNAFLNDPTKNTNEFINFRSVDEVITKTFIQLTLGTIDLLEDYYHQGQELSLSFEFSDRDLLSDESFVYIKLDGRIFIILKDDVTMGHHLALWTSSTNTFYRKYFLGGFNNLRGFLGTRFHGDNLYFYNFEIRIPFFKGDFWFIKDFVGIAVPFFDIGYAWDGDYLGKNTFDNYAADVGLGLRFKIRRIRDAQFRIDFAFSLHPNEMDTFISTGLLHFF